MKSFIVGFLVLILSPLLIVVLSPFFFYYLIKMLGDYFLKEEGFY